MVLMMVGDNDVFYRSRADRLNLLHQHVVELIAEIFCVDHDQSVRSNADAGILALSLAVAPAMKEAGRYFEIPSSEYPTIEQAAIVLQSSKHKDTARQFIDFLKRPETVKLMESYGFAVPQK